MAYATIDYTGSVWNTNSVFTTPPYLEGRTQDISVTVRTIGGNTFTPQIQGTHYTLTGTEVKFLAGHVPVSTSLIRITRSSFATSRLVDYQDGARLQANTLDLDSNQNFFIAQEALDEAFRVNLSAESFYTSGNTAPLNPNQGDLWFDTSTNYPILKVYDGTDWDLINTSVVSQKFTLQELLINIGNNLVFDGMNHDGNNSQVFLNGVKLVQGTNGVGGASGNFNTDAGALQGDYYFEKDVSPSLVTGYNSSDPLVVIKDVWDSSNSTFATGFTGNDFVEVISIVAGNSEDVLIKNGVTKAQATTTGIDVTGDINFTGNGNIKWPLTKLQVLHNGAAGYVAASTDLYIKGYKTELVDNGYRKRLSTHGGDSGNIRLYHGNPSNNNDWKLRTEATGIGVTGTVTADVFSLNNTTTEFSAFTDNQDVTWLSKNGTGTLKLKSYKANAADSTTDDGIHIRTDDLKLKSNSGADIAQFSYDSAANTKSVNIDGTVTADGISVGDGENISLGDSNELVIKHHADGGSTITETGSGNLALVGNAVTIKNVTGTNEFQIVCDGTGATNKTKLYYGQPSDTADFKLGTTTSGVQVKGTITADSLDLSGNTTGSNSSPLEALKLPTNSKIEFDNTFSLQHQIWSGIPYAYIRETGSGGLRLEGASLSIFTNDGSSDNASFGVQRLNASAGATGNVKLYYGNETNFANHKFETTSTGVNVVGTVTADSLDIDGNATFTSSDTYDQVIIENTSTSTTSAPDLKFRRSGAVGQASNIGVVAFNALNSTPTDFSYANIVVDAVDLTAGSEKGKIKFQVADPSDGLNYPVPRLSVDKDGIDVTGTVTADGVTVGTGDVITVGEYANSTDGTSQNLRFYINANGNAYIDHGHDTGGLIVLGRNFNVKNDASEMLIQTSDTTTSLYHNSSANPKLDTTSSGINVTGTVTATGISVGDAHSIYVGANNDLEIVHRNDGSQRTDILESGGGNLRIAGRAIELNNDTGANEYQIVLDGTGATNRTRLFSGQPSDSTDYKLSTNPNGVDVKGTVTADSITSAPTTVVTTNSTVPTVAVNKKYIDTYDSGVNAYVLPTGTVGQMITFVNASTQNITLNRNTNSITLEKVIAGSDPANVTDATITVGKSGAVEVVYTGTNTAVIFGSGIS